MAMILTYTMWILILTPIVSYLAGRILKNRTGFLTASGLALATFLLISIVPEVSVRGVYEECVWVSTPSPRLELRADGLSLILAIAIGLLSCLASIYSVEYMRSRDGCDLYFGLLSLMTLAMTGTVLVVDLAILLFFWEFMVVIPVFLIARWGYDERWPTAIRFFLFSRFGGGLLLAGLILAYASFGTLDMRILPYIIHESHMKSEILMLIAILMILGFSVKMAIWPFHGWIPSAYANAPIPIAMILSSVTSKLGAYGIVRVIQIFGESIGLDYGFIAILALITALYGGVMALIKDDLREILAYSSMSHMGYILLGLSTLDIHSHGFTGAITHIVNHTLSKGILFLCLGSIIRLLGETDIKRIRGWYRRSPTLFALATVGALGLIGLPPTLGFWSKDMLLGFSLKLGYPTASLTIIAALLSVLYNFRWILYALTRSTYEKPMELPLTMATPIAILAILALTPLAYVDYVVHLANIEHMVIEPIPLLITIISLTLGSSLIYAYISRRLELPSSILGFSTTLFSVVSLEWMYTGVFIRGSIKLAYYTYKWVEGAIDGFNYIVAGGVSRLSEHVRKLQTGILSYNMLMILLILLILLIYIVIGIGTL